MCMAMMADGRVRVEPMHSATVTIDELASTIDDLAGGRSAHTKVLVDPRR